ncbi:MAG: hypothetical protein A2Y97_10845 [Nitrospirae bacterium RBG_13_39_12]|nr:MAG: hypothetical protein A2Y97_10845 [Nitrospirae bacterium RBG_13_39_12]
MKFADIFTNKSEQRLSLTNFYFADILIPSLQKGMMAQTHYIFPASDQSAVSLQVDLKDTEEDSRADFEESMDKWSIDHDTFPYGLSESQWWEYCLSPHSYLALENGKCQVGLNLFNRFLHLDLNGQSSQLVDPEVGNELLSTTNWFDPARQELWFASWPAEATVRRILNPHDTVRVKIWKLSFRDKRVEQVWEGNLGDSLHQLSLSPDHSFLILTELGLRPEEALPAGCPNQNQLVWKRVLERGIVPSEVLVLNLKTGEESRLPMLTAGHVEFDPEDPEICYLSGHNIGLFGVKVGIFGTGKIQKFRLKESGLELLGEFTHPCFHRITTHIVFRHPEKTLISVSGYPDTIFLIDAATMKLHRTIKMDTKEIVDTSQSPHICRQDSYGIAASGDGQSLLVAGTGFIRVANIDEGRFTFTGNIKDYSADSCFTGHVGNIGFPGKT